MVGTSPQVLIRFGGPETRLELVNFDLKISMSFTSNNMLKAFLLENSYFFFADLIGKLRLTKFKQYNSLDLKAWLFYRNCFEQIKTITNSQT